MKQLSTPQRALFPIYVSNFTKSNRIPIFVDRYYGKFKQIAKPTAYHAVGLAIFTDLIRCELSGSICGNPKIQRHWS
ncbi:hypothetical protein [Halotia branconii]|uniref:Uncharacterized protein n=1 Tax=Halotia branconii CENA392 TaxID=1539056 RepID=A0AAJ6P8W3_9CYAN|nr:hypothetical protein [Halotia branconii]WGV25036.1 hypothetical protein QI031_25250 [Halotia branconii CENA392]